MRDFTMILADLVPINYLAKNEPSASLVLYQATSSGIITGLIDIKVQYNSRCASQSKETALLHIAVAEVYPIQS